MPVQDRLPLSQSASLIFSLALIGSGCAVGPNYEEPRFQIGTTFVSSQSDPSFHTEDPNIAWWRSFNDPLLQELLDSSVADNTTIDQALARLRQARAQRRETTLDLFPTVRANGGYTSSERSQAVAAGANFGPRHSESFSGSFDALWEMDIFGRVRRSLEAREAAEDAALYDLRDILQSVLAEVARNYFELRGLQHQRAVAKESVSTLEQSNHLTEALVKAGQSTELDSARAEAQLQATRATIPPIEAAIRQTMFRLAVLVGKEPGSLIEQLTPVQPLPTYDGPINLGDPQMLLRRRPDVRAAERRLAAATARIGVATADFFPRLTLEGTFALEATSLKKWRGGSASAFSVGPRLSWAAFDIGRVWEQVDLADAEAQESLAYYQETVLKALEDTENSISRFALERDRRNSLRLGNAASQRAFELANAQYQAGLIDFLSLLDTQRTWLQSQDQLSQSETTLATNLVAIAKALGGGWQEYEVRETDEVTK